MWKRCWNSWKWYAAIIISVWCLTLAAVLWANLGHHYLVVVPLGLLSVPVPFSVSMKLITGKWPDWPAVWRLFRHRD